MTQPHTDDVIQRLVEPLTGLTSIDDVVQSAGKIVTIEDKQVILESSDFYANRLLVTLEGAEGGQPTQPRPVKPVFCLTYFAGGNIGNYVQMPVESFLTMRRLWEAKVKDSSCRLVGVHIPSYNAPDQYEIISIVTGGLGVPLANAVKDNILKLKESIRWLSNRRSTT